ncbi:SGNH/GDSL hydrolase family protein [Microbacterium sp. gxy059]|uniref:SGNH/GDSL hydrolase family protein n=1 Tax=Microbacterium sp. gxy059 TaxID=2957199 RepID=UPI003D95B8EB
MPTLLRRAAAPTLLVALALAGCASAPTGVDVSSPWIDGPEDRTAGSGGAPASESASADVAAPDETGGPTDLLIFGDSWTVGLASTNEQGGYAYLTGRILGWETTVAGESGSGYLRPGRDGGVYAPRIAALDPALSPDVVVLQGSINDRLVDLSGYDDAVAQAWSAMQTRFPDADLVILGPAPHVLPVGDDTALIDQRLDALAEARSLPYISPVQEGWITESNYDAVIDASKTGGRHPSDDGHAYLAGLVAAHLAQLVPDDGAPAETPTETTDASAPVEG